MENKALLKPLCKSSSIPAAHSTNAAFKATTSICDFCPEPSKTDFNISSLESRSETTSFSFEIFS